VPAQIIALHGDIAKTLHGEALVGKKALGILVPSAFSQPLFILGKEARSYKFYEQ